MGRCDPPDFASAGPHWNPAGHKHGMNNPAGPHAGDLPNVEVAANGVLGATVTLPGAVLVGGGSTALSMPTARRSSSMPAPTII